VAAAVLTAGHGCQVRRIVEFNENIGFWLPESGCSDSMNPQYCGLFDAFPYFEIAALF